MARDETTTAGTSLAPLDVFFDSAAGVEAPLSPALAALYGRLAFPTDGARPWVVSNFVSSIDGVVAFNDPIPPDVSEISASNPHDRAIMGLLRALADAVIVGAGTLRAVPRHRWTAQFIYHPLAQEYAALRAALGKLAVPLSVVVSGSGDVDTTLPIFQQPDAAALLVTTAAGASRLADRTFGPLAHAQAVEANGAGGVSARATLDATLAALPATSGAAPLILVEGGPLLLARFVAEGLLDEQFLTIAPQLIGRDDEYHRPGLIEGQRLAPDSPRWGRLVSVRRASDFLFLRYAFTPQE